MFLGTERNGFVRSLDGGRTWTRRRAGLRAINDAYAEVWDIAISPSNPLVMMAALVDSPGPPSGPRATPGLYKSTDGGDSWVQMNCGLTTSRALSVSIHPANLAVAVAGLEGGVPSFTGDSRYYPGGIFRTEDGGGNWSRVQLGPGDERHGYLIMRLVPTNPPTLITFASSGEGPSQNLGFARSRDMGRTWELFASELRRRPINAFDVSSNGQVIYADEQDTYFGWVSRDGGATWSRSDIVQVNGTIAVSPADPNLVLFTSVRELRRSLDGLGTVQVVLTAPDRIAEIVFAPSNASIVYAAADGYLVYRSDDAGATWRLLANVRDDVLNAQP